MRIGFYGSSFDPITNAHLWTASAICDRARLDKVIFAPCQNHRGDGKVMKTEDEHRWNMLKLALDDEPLFEADDYEMRAKAGPGKQYSYFTMNHIKEKFPDDDVFFIMGADLLLDIDNQDVPEHKRWKHRKEFVSTNRFIVMARDNIDMLKAISKSPLLRHFDDGTRFHLIDKGFQMDISSTFIRDEISMGNNPRRLLPDACIQYIVENELYNLPKNTTFPFL